MGKKWSDAKPAEKLLTLYTILLFSRREISLTELSNTLGCSKQAVSRLITQLEGSRFGKVLRQQKGREAQFTLERPRQLPTVSLNAEGLQQLALCREFLAHLLPDALHKEMALSLRQASAFLPEEAQGLPVNVGGSLSKGSIDYAPFQKSLRTLMQAIREGIVCAVRYKASLHGEEKSFDYAPKRLLAFRESLLVQGVITTDKGRALPLYATPTTLALHRLKACALTRRSAAYISDIPLPDNTAFGVMQGESTEIAVRFAPEAATYVAERQWSEAQSISHHEDGSITLHLQVQSIPECRAWVLSFGETAEVLSPEWLRNDIGKTISVLSERYAAVTGEQQ